MEMHNDIQETIGHPIVPSVNEADLENELSELLLEDIPSVPPEPPSPQLETADRALGGKFSNFGLSYWCNLFVKLKIVSDLPTVPNEGPQSPIRKAAQVPL